MIQWGLQCEERVGIFSVWKKNGGLRLIIDARPTNCYFEDADAVRLCSGQAFSELRVDGHDTGHVVAVLAVPIYW